MAIGDVSAGDDITAAKVNSIISQIEDTSTGHDHDGTDSNHFIAIGGDNYSGNDGTNRAIAHGLGLIPKAVIMRNSDNYIHLIINDGTTINVLADNLRAAYAVTDWTATNFYVGNPTSYVNSGNGTGTTYYWVAVG